MFELVPLKSVLSKETGFPVKLESWLFKTVILPADSSITIPSLPPEMILSDTTKLLLTLNNSIFGCSVFCELL